MGIVLNARSRAMGGEDVVGEVKGVEEVGVGSALWERLYFIIIESGLCICSLDFPVWF